MRRILGRAVSIILTCVLAGSIGGASMAGEPAKRPCKKKSQTCEAPRPSWWEGWSMEDPRLSQPTYEETVVQDIEIFADDGERLNARVLRPSLPDDVRIPAIMQLSPYLGSDIAPESILPELQKHDYVQRGYALVGVSLRGSGGSGGCVDYQGARDTADVDAILDAIAAQPWSNGKVGGIGLSWDGTSLNSAALTGNEHLTTIVPAAAITDWYKWSFMKGVPVWIVGHTYNIYAPPTVQAAFGRGVPPADAADRACPTAIDSIVVQEESALTGVRNDWWDERDMGRLVDQIDPDLSVLQVQGSLDLGVRPDQLHTWDPALRERLPNYRLLMGSWGHLWPDTPDIPAFSNPDVEFNRHPLNSWSVILLRWFDQWLKGTDTGIMAMPGALIQDNLGQWHEEDSLRPSRSTPIRLYPGAGGALTSTPASASASFIDDGQGVDPRGSCIYVGVGWLVGCAPARTPNAQFFTTPPYEVETRFSGIPKVDLRLSHSQVHGRVGVTLYDVNGDHWKPLTYAISSLNLRDGNQHEFVPVVPGEFFSHQIEFMARDFVLPAGHRLGLAIGSQVDMNPRGISGNGFAPTPSGGTTELELGEGTVLELNLLPETTRLIPIP
ncbi:MAG TPA: CocE/NonD family hydrolase [Actinomycetota bacterium]|nr:CocE/NonD family hydrolase [Actinomycetota bacterium]